MRCRPGIAALFAAAAPCFGRDCIPGVLEAEARSMFSHAYDGYMQHAFPRDELRPLSMVGVDSLAEIGNLDGKWLERNNYTGIALTYIESLTTHAVMNNASEFEAAVLWLERNPNLFNQNVRVNVFEVIIRVLGPLVSAHMLATYVNPSLCTGYNTTMRGSPLLDLAADLGNRLLRAFDASPTGLPFAWVNLQTGVYEDETSESNLAGAGTNILELGMLSRLTGNPAYEEAAVACLSKLWEMRSQTGLFGTSLDVRRGEWFDAHAGIGFGADSYYEYLLKAYLLFGDPWYYGMFAASYESVQRYMRSGPWYADVHRLTGLKTQETFTSLQAFFPAVQAELGDIAAANATHRAFYSVWERYGLLPERYLYQNSLVHPTMKYYPLRPELVESTFFLHQATADPYYTCVVGKRLMDSLNSHTRVATGGYAAVRDVETMEKEDHMHSFFLSETLKYLLLLYNSTFLQSHPFVFTTEGHPLPVLDQFRGVRTGRQLPARYRGARCWGARTAAPRRPLGQGCSGLDLRVCPWQGAGEAHAGVSVRSACHVPDDLPAGQCTQHEDCGVDADSCRERLCGTGGCFTPGS